MFSLLVSKGIDHYWKLFYLFIFPGGLQQMEGPCFPEAEHGDFPNRDGEDLTARAVYLESLGGVTGAQRAYRWG